MSGKLHFSKLQRVERIAGEEADSGNGYYSYSYFTIPFSGTITTPEDMSRVSAAFHKRFYNPPFASMGTWKVVETRSTGGTIRFSTRITTKIDA